MFVCIIFPGFYVDSLTFHRSLTDVIENLYEDLDMKTSVSRLVSPAADLRADNSKNYKLTTEGLDPRYCHHESEHPSSSHRSEDNSLGTY